MTDGKQTEMPLDDHELLLRLAKQQRTAVIQPDDVAYVDFENKYDKTQGGGGSFVNNFKYTDETGWEGNRVDDNSTGSTVVKPFNKD